MIFSLLSARLGLRYVAPPFPAARRVAAATSHLNITRSFTLSRALLAAVASKKGPAAKSVATKAKTSARKSSTKKATTQRPAKKATGPRIGKKPVKERAKKVGESNDKSISKITREMMPPKNPGSSYMLFFRKYLQGVRVSGPDAREQLQNHAREGGRVWQAMSNHEKQAFRDELAVLRADYAKDKYAYFKSVDPAVLKKINERRVKKGKKRILTPKDLRPRRPITSYFLFMSEERQNKPPEQPQQEFALECGTKWRAMTDAEKQPYIDRYRESVKTLQVKNAA